MRLLIAALAAVAAVAFTAPSFAQESTPPAATSTAKPKAKPRTTAYCNSLKSSSSKSACLKRVHASAKPSSSKGKAKKVDPTKTDTSAQLMAPPAAPSPSTSQTVAIPPLPEKTI